MKLQAKISILLALILGVFILSFLTYQYIRTREKKLLYIENKKSQEMVLDKVMQLNRIKYEQLINDNSGWDEMVEFAQAPDTVWAKDNVNFFVNSFQLSFVQVYSKEQEPVYVFGDSLCLKQFGHPEKEAIRSSFADTAFVHYYQYCEKGLIEIFGAIIVPAADSDTRKSPPFGYIYIGRLWDAAYIDEHSQATSFHAELVSVADLPNMVREKGKNYFIKELKDSKGVPVATVVFSKHDPLDESMTPLLYLSFLVTAVAVVAMLVFLYYFRKIILVPIHQISSTLNTRNPEQMDSTSESTEEFIKLKSLILQFFLQEELLRNKNAELRENNANKDKLFSIIAHDLKNPVGNMQVISELMMDSYRNKDFETLEELLEMIGTQSKETLSLLETLFEWAKSQAGKINYTPEEVNLKEIVPQVVDIINPIAALKGITIESDVESDLKVFADKNMIYTVLRNLVSNATKFTNSGGSIHILANKQTDDIEISVKDTGVGMSSETLRSLFHVDSNITTRGTAGEKGSGLGLIICKEFIEKHGRHIQVDSLPNEGSKFTFCLPSA